MQIKQLLLLALITLVTACNLSSMQAKPVKYKSVVKDGTYKIMLPDFMDTTTTMQEGKSLQYQNQFKELYVLMVHENKQHLKEIMVYNQAMRDIFPDSISMMESYFAYMNRNLAKEAYYNVFDSSLITVKKANAKIASVTLTTTDKIKIFYRIAAIEANKEIYQLYIWTTTAHKEKYQPIMDSIIRSVKEF